MQPVEMLNEEGVVVAYAERTGATATAVDHTCPALEGVNALGLRPA